MKYAIGGLVLVVLAVGAFFVFAPGQSANPSNPGAAVIVAPADHIFLHPKKVDVPFNAAKMEYAEKLFKEQRYDDAVAVWAMAYEGSHSDDTRASAILLAAQALLLKEKPADQQEASKLYQLYLSQYPKDRRADSAYYNLGRIALEKRNLGDALYYFATVLDEYPNSPFAPNSAFAARYAAGVVSEQNRTLRGRILSRVQPFLPRNSAALLSVLTSSVTLLVWLLYDWENSYKKLMQHKNPMLWVLIVLLVALATANYVLEDKEDAQSTVDAIKALGKVNKK